MLVLFSRLLPNPKLEMSVLSICLSTASLAYVIPFGVGVAVSTRVSNELGLGHSGIARGCGWQNLGVYVNLGAYYAVGIPTAIVLAFVFHVGGKWRYIGVMLAHHYSNYPQQMSRNDEYTATDDQAATNEHGTNDEQVITVDLLCPMPILQRPIPELTELAHSTLPT
eukprot:Gb_29738 [translate_table: standard]